MDALAAAVSIFEKAVYAEDLLVSGSGRSFDMVSVRLVNFSQLAFLKFQRFLFKLLILISMLLRRTMGQWPERGNLSRITRSHLAARSVDTSVRSGFDHFLWRPEKKVGWSLASYIRWRLFTSAQVAIVDPLVLVSG